MSNCDSCAYNYVDNFGDSYCHMECKKEVRSDSFKKSYRQYLLSLYDIFLQKSFD